MKVAIVCDWLTGTGGAERVVLELHKMFPEAPIYTSQYNSDPRIWFGETWFSGADVRTGWLQKLPTSLKKFMPLLRTIHFSRLDLSEYDLVISSSGAEAKGVKTGPKTVHINYCHSPTHYYWNRYEQYIANPGLGKLNWLARLGLRLLLGNLRKKDLAAAKRPDYIVANSTHTKNQIQKYYGRDAAIVHPPVDIERFSVKSDEPRRGFVTAGRQTPYKKIDIAVEACTKLDVPLVVIGRGPDHAKLERMAGRSVTFLQNVDDEQMAHYFASSLGFIFTSADDFGIVAVEAMAAGTPLIAYKDGGALDYVKEGKTGVFFDEQTADSLANVLEKFTNESFRSSEIVAEASKYSDAEFRSKMGAFIKKCLAN